MLPRNVAIMHVSKLYILETCFTATTRFSLLFSLDNQQLHAWFTAAFWKSMLESEAAIRLHISSNTKNSILFKVWRHRLFSAYLERRFAEHFIPTISTLITYESQCTWGFQVYGKTLIPHRTIRRLNWSLSFQIKMSEWIYFYGSECFWKVK